MKKFFGVIVLLLCVTLVAMWINDTINVRLILSSTANTAYKTHRLFIEQPENEIGIFGSSRALLHYVPPKISTRAFNYGCNGSAMNETLFLVKQGIRNKGIAPIIINLDPWGFPKDHEITYRLNYQLALENDLLRTVLPETQTQFKERCPGIRFHGALRSNLATYLNTMRSVTKEIVAGASLELNSRTAEEWQKINVKSKEWDFYCDAVYQKELDEIYSSTSRPIIWVIGPVAPVMRSKFKGQAELNAFITKQRLNENVYVVDLYSPTSDWNEDLFVDATHLNKKGAIRFTELLTYELKREKKLAVFFE